MAALALEIPWADPDADQVRRALKHDPTAFAELVERYQGPLYGLCLRLLGDSVEAEDAAQETFLRAHLHLRTYDCRRRFKTWLFAIASHYCIDRLRARRLQWTALDEDAPTAIDPAPSPEACAEQLEFEAHLRSWLNHLAPADQLVLNLHYWLGFSYAEIAETTGTTVSAVKSRLHRAREKWTAPAL
jgi:RNA polymerase sigma-70 factor (ECF subfamily)